MLVVNRQLARKVKYVVSTEDIVNQLKKICTDLLPLSCILCVFSFFINISTGINCIGGVMVSMLVSSAVDRGFEPRSDQTKD
jgi:hypothetical protein